MDKELYKLQRKYQREASLKEKMVYPSRLKNIYSIALWIFV